MITDELRTTHPTAACKWRTELLPEDPAKIRDLVEATRVFSPEEVDIAQELADERIEKGPASGYDFALLCEGENLLGYACFGRVAGTDATWNLYWIAVDRVWQGTGFGAAIIKKAERDMGQKRARKIIAETSTSEQYAATRRFYSRVGYSLTAEIADYYRPGDGLAIFVKDIAESVLERPGLV